MTRDEIVDRLMAERYAGEWWTRRATEAEPVAAGPSLPGTVEDELEARRGRIRLAELNADVEDFHHNRNRTRTERIF